MQLRETTMAPETRRLVQLVLRDPEEAGENGEPPPAPSVGGAEAIIDKLLAKARSADRREWLMAVGDRAEVEV